MLTTLIFNLVLVTFIVVVKAKHCPKKEEVKAKHVLLWVKTSNGT